MDRRTARALMERLTRDADRICGRFGLQYTKLAPERANVKRRYGICYSDGTIQIRLQHAATGQPLKYSSLVNTLCHELAHLRHFNHGERFQNFYARLLAWARQEGIYRPGPPIAGASRPAPPPAPPAARPAALIRRRKEEEPRPVGPEQLSLFS